jgi:arginase family enzyme
LNSLMNGPDRLFISQHQKKLFGVALDPVDDPRSLQLKHAWMAADTTKLDWLAACPDPYSAVTETMAGILEEQYIQPVGRFSVPSWLWPKPKQSDRPLVNAGNMADFFDSGQLFNIVKELQCFVTDSILPETPIMVGIDHSATAGVVSALAKRYGPEMLCVVVLDQHFDAIPLSVRLAGTSRVNRDLSPGIPFAVPNIPIGFCDQFCCGNFWAYLIDQGTVLPDNLLFIGVADYPDQKADSGIDDFRRQYLSYEERGCSFFTRWQFDGQYLDRLTRFCRKKITAPYVYVSLDLDIGSYNSTYAARYMDRQGISKQNLLDIASVISSRCHQGSLKIAGLDIMEFNMHFLGIETRSGIKDMTLALVGEFIKTLN